MVGIAGRNRSSNCDRVELMWIEQIEKEIELKLDRVLLGSSKMRRSSNWEDLRIEKVFEMRGPQTEKVFELRGPQTKKVFELRGSRWQVWMDRTSSCEGFQVERFVLRGPQLKRSSNCSRWHVSMEGLQAERLSRLRGSHWEDLTLRGSLSWTHLRRGEFWVWPISLSNSILERQN